MIFGFGVWSPEVIVWFRWTGCALLCSGPVHLTKPLLPRGHLFRFATRCRVRQFSHTTRPNTTKPVGVHGLVDFRILNLTTSFFEIGWVRFRVQHVTKPLCSVGVVRNSTVKVTKPYCPTDLASFGRQARVPTRVALNRPSWEWGVDRGGRGAEGVRRHTLGKQNWQRGMNLTLG